MRSQFNWAFRYYARYIFQLPSLYKPDGSPHIFIFSSRRSGSTLLRDMIASQPYFNYIDEPFNFSSNQYNPYRHLFKEHTQGQIVSLSDVEKKKISRSYLDNLLTRKYITRSQWRFFDKNYHWVWKRYVVKELNAKNLMPWFEKEFGNKIKIIYHVRHPFAVTASLLERGWEHYSTAFLNDDEYRKKYITQKIHTMARKVLRSGSKAEKYVLDWCFENYVPLKLYKNHLWIKISYESIVSDPGAVSEKLCKALNLPNVDAMASVVKKPSPTTLSRSKKEISNYGPGKRLSAWQNKLNSYEVEKLWEILKTFDIDLYTYESIYPKNSFENI